LPSSKNPSNDGAFNNDIPMNAGTNAQEQDDEVEFEAKQPSPLGQEAPEIIDEASKKGSSACIGRSSGMPLRRSRAV